MKCKDCEDYLDDSDRCVKRGYCNRYSTKHTLYVVDPNQVCVEEGMKEMLKGFNKAYEQRRKFSSF